MFKKPPSTKTSSPLRSSERRKLRNSLASRFSVEQNIADDLFPDPIYSAKFKTHLDQPGVLYLDSSGNARWFTVSHSEELVPSVFTLIKHPNLLPSFWTGAGVVPALLNGADLMAPGVIHHPKDVSESQLVSICRYSRDPASGDARLSSPVAVGRAAMSGASLTTTAKGKAVLVLTTWKDALWDIGTKADGDLPDFPLKVSEAESQELEQSLVTESSSSPPPVEEQISPLQFRVCSPQEISELLRISLVHAITKVAQSELTFPITSSTFSSSFVLPSRPAFPSALLHVEEPINPLDIGIKGSTHKTFAAFLKSAEKENLLTLKQPQKHSNQTDILITSVNTSHPAISELPSFQSLGDIEQKAAKKAERERVENDANMKHAQNVEVNILFMPHGKTLPLFEKIGRTTATYTVEELKQVLSTYIAKNQLANPEKQAFVNLDTLLESSISSKAKFETEIGMKREELVAAIVAEMQEWYEIRAPGKEVLRKKGTINPIEIGVKMKQGNKAVTTIHGFEPFLVVEPNTLADNLRKLCAGSTSIGQIPGKPANAGVEVTVQGKQTTAVEAYLISKGIPKHWIKVKKDSQTKKKK
ncbi:eukaryotic translation initiation factor SUI1 family protein [Flagelloscypha sp. PMI_526]|nr:eukaryotic translation initiation factor SUI1 family protein [Flagelloscypha sp. PMI_526]